MTVPDLGIVQDKIDRPDQPMGPRLFRGVL